jgi:hypothetical protein
MLEEHRRQTSARRWLIPQHIEQRSHPTESNRRKVRFNSDDRQTWKLVDWYVPSEVPEPVIAVTLTVQVPRMSGPTFSRMTLATAPASTVRVMVPPLKREIDTT